MKDFLKFKTQVSLKGFTLIIPTVSVGNVPQLTADLLITTYNLQKTALIWHPAIISSVGADPYLQSGPEVCTACELYTSEELKLAVMQLRSTIDFKLATKFSADLKAVIEEHKFNDVVILTSSFDHELHVVSSDKFYYISNQENIEDSMKTFNIKQKEAEFTGKYVVHGSGFAVQLYETLKSAVKCTVLIKFVAEGDNRPDAVITLEMLSKFVNNLKNIPPVRTPVSWNYVFGGPAPLSIY